MSKPFTAQQLRDWARLCLDLAQNPGLSDAEKARLDKSRAHLDRLAELKEAESESVLVEFVLPEKRISILQ